MPTPKEIAIAKYGAVISATIKSRMDTDAFDGKAGILTMEQCDELGALIAKSAQEAVEATLRMIPGMF